MMKQILRLTALLLSLMTLMPCALAASATPTPPPVEIISSPVEPPEDIRAVLDIAYNEWETLAGKTLPRVNKFTEWRGKGYSFGWCGGYITWCMIEGNIPMGILDDYLDTSNDTPEGFYPAQGSMHVKEASVGKLLRGYQRMNRTTMVPQPGYLLVYGCSYNKTIHIGLVYDVEELGNGRYRITTLEGNMSSRVKMYVRDYDMNAVVNTNNRKSTNLYAIPEDERPLPESSYVDYSVTSAKPSSGASNKYMYYVHCFLMPWVPTEEDLATPVPATPVPATPEPTVEPTAEPVVEATPDATAEPAAEATPEATAEPVVEATPEPTAEPAVPTYPCHGKDGACTYITYHEDDLYCRTCDRNDNGVEDALE